MEPKPDTVPNVSSEIAETKQVLVVGRKKLLATFHETIDSTSIYIGGSHYFCAYANITKPESSLSNVIDTSIGHLARLSYNQGCDLEKQFQRRTDTRMILLLMIAVIKDTFPYVSRIQFTDTSYRVCNNGSVAELSELYYITTGHTWYESQFGAYLEGDAHTKFKIADTKFQEQKSRIPWDVMRRTMGVTDDTWQPLYESATTWQEFFGPVRDKIGVADFCEFVAPWLHMFLFKTMRFHFSGVSYNIDIATAPPITYTTEPWVQAAGRRQTRCRPKQQRSRNET